MRTVDKMHVATMPHATESMTVKAVGGLVEYWSWREGEAVEVEVVFMFMGGLAVRVVDLDRHASCATQIWTTRVDHVQEMCYIISGNDGSARR